MKTLIILTALALPLTAQAWNCPNGENEDRTCKPVKPPKPEPKPTPSPTPVFVPLTATQQQALQAQLQAAATATSSSAAKASAVGSGYATGGTSNAAGGNSSSSNNVSSTSGSSTGGTSSLADNSMYNSRSWALSIATPVFTPPMAPIACPSANVKQMAAALGGGLIGSYAEGSTDSSDCTLIQLRNAKVETCQYASAKQIEDLLAQKYLPKYAANGKPFEDYNASECALMKAPPPAPTPIVFQEMLPPAKVPAPKPAKKAAKKDDCKWQCVPTGR
jgi:hypothetical protein